MSEISFFTGCFISIHIIAISFFFLSVFIRSFTRKIESDFLPQNSAHQLAFIRILVCSISLIYVTFIEYLPDVAVYDSNWYQAPGYFSLLGDSFWNYLVSNQVVLYGIQYALIFCLLSSIFGFRTKVVLPIAAILYFVEAAILRSWGKDFHSGYLSCYLLILLCFLPASEVWSLDSKNSKEIKPYPYNWAIYLCYTVACIPYLQLGFSKLIVGGIGWVNGDSLLHYLLVDNLNYTRFEIDQALRFHQLPIFVFTFAAGFALLSELAYPLVIVSRKLRQILPICITALHLGIFIVQDVLFFDYIFIPLIFIQISKFRITSSAGLDVEVQEKNSFRTPIKTFFKLSITCIFLISFLTFFHIRYFRWPFVTYTMYSPKGSSSSLISYRNFLIEDDKGRQEIKEMDEVSKLFLGEYRIDKAIIKDPIAFLKESLELINHSSNKEPVRSLSYQRRVWDYKKEGFGKLENLGERQYLLCLTKFNGFFPDVKNQKPNLLKNASFNQAEEEFKILGSPKFWEGDWDAVYYYYDSNSIDLSLSLLNQEVYQDVLLDEKEKLQNLKFKVYIYSFGSIRIEYFYRDDLLYSVIENTDTYDSWQTLNVDYPLNGKKIDRVRVILTNKTNKKSLFYRPELVGLN